MTWTLSIDRTNTPGTTIQAEFLSKTVVFLICQEPGPIIGVGLTALPTVLPNYPVGASALVPAGDIALNATATASTWVPLQVSLTRFPLSILELTMCDSLPLPQSTVSSLVTTTLSPIPLERSRMSGARTESDPTPGCNSTGLVLSSSPVLFSTIDPIFTSTSRPQISMIRSLTNSARLTVSSRRRCSPSPMDPTSLYLR